MTSSVIYGGECGAENCINLFSFGVFLCALCGLKKVNRKVRKGKQCKVCKEKILLISLILLNPSSDKELLYKSATPMKLINDIMSGSKN